MADVNYTDRYFDNATLLEQLDEERARKLSPVTAYLIVVMVTGIVGNSLVCYVHGVKMKKSTANSFILWLAILDLTTCFVGLPMEIYDFFYHYTFGVPVFCKIFRFTVYFTIITAVTTLLFIAADRYCKICRPLKHSVFRRCRGVVVVSLFTGAILSWPALVVFGNKRNSTPYPGLYGVECSLDDYYIGTSIPTIYLGALTLCFMCSAIVIIILYSLIGCKLYRRSQSVIGEHVTQRRVSNASFHNIDAGKVDRSRKFSVISVISQTGGLKRYKRGRTVLIFMSITLVFVLSFLPSLALMTVRTVKPNFESTLSDTEYVLYCFGLRTYFINNSINFIIYGCVNPIFRRECVQIWRRVKSRKCHRNQKKERIRKTLSDSSRTEPVTEESLQAVRNIYWATGTRSDE